MLGILHVDNVGLYLCAAAVGVCGVLAVGPARTCSKHQAGGIELKKRGANVLKDTLSNYCQALAGGEPSVQVYR